MSSHKLLQIKTRTLLTWLEYRFSLSKVGSSSGLSPLLGTLGRCSATRLTGSPPLLPSHSRECGASSLEASAGLQFPLVWPPLWASPTLDSLPHRALLSSLRKTS